MTTPARFAALLLDWFAVNARDLPWRHTRDPYAIWVSEVMLQQTQVRTVVPYWNRWMAALPSVPALAAAPPEQVLKLWEGLGYYHRARNLQKAARAIALQHQGAFPRRPEAVLALPGIGPYTAGAVCSLAFNLPTPVLDGNVTRVLTRLYGVRQRVDRASTRRRLAALAQALVSAAATTRLSRGSGGWRTRRVHEVPCGALNEALMELGAVICTPRQPRCPDCPLRRHCTAQQTGDAEALPRKPRRPGTLERELFVFVGRRNGRWLVRRRPSGGVNAGLWEWPSIETAGHPTPLAAAQALLGPGLVATALCFVLEHSITRHRIRLQVHEVTVTGRVRSGRTGRWLGAGALDRLAFPAAHRKIFQRLVAPTMRLAERAGDGTVRA